MMSPQIRSALAMAGVILVGAVALVVAKRSGLIDGDVAVRGSMALLGLVMAVYANGIPKSVVKKTAHGQAMQRLTGRALFLAYLAWVAIWIFAPMSLVNFAAIVPVLLAGGVIVFACMRGRRETAA